MKLGINPLLLVAFFPLVGFLIIVFLKETQKEAIRWTALGTSLVTFGLSLWMLAQFKVGEPGLQLTVRVPWLTVGGINIDFFMAVDGLSILLVLLTTFLTPIVILSTWTAVKDHVKGFMLFFLLLEVGLTGVFMALDLVLFYVFWEFTLIPMYFLIGIWGGERRIYAAVKFFLFTMFGSLLMLVAIVFMGMQAHSFAWTDLVAQRATFSQASLWLFLAFALAFAIKVPMFPLHTWLPDAHVEAPTAGSVILAAVMLKMGAYGLLRFNLALFPEVSVQAAPYMAVLAVIGVLYGAAVAMVQTDVKKLVAYSSISHLGFVVLGTFALTAQGVSGAVLQMVNHGLSTGALFLVVGMLYERRHTRDMSQFGGILKVTPVLAILMMIVTLSSMGLPGLNGFVGEFTILLGSFGSDVLGSPWYAGVATVGVILAAVYLLVMYEKVFLGPVKVEANQALKDVNAREILVLLPLLIMIFWIGLHPQPFFDLINPSVQSLVETVKSAALAIP